jgi:hypothetical protein
MEKSIWMMAISVLGVVLACGQAEAITLTESGDAGEQIDTAQALPTGTLSLDSIVGALAGDADVFKLFLTGGQTFSATTINLETLLDLPVDNSLGTPTDLLNDPQLFLFDAVGKGIYGNDDTDISPQSVLASGEFAPTEPGTYYLAIAGSGYNPVSATGEIFASPLPAGVLQPIGAGGQAALQRFAGDRSQSQGRYAIALTGVQAGTPTEPSPRTVPESTTVLGLLAIGALGVGSRLQRKK